MLDVKRLRILREVAEHGSFSAAADSLHLTQSAVSQQIAALEKETQTKLLDRNHGSVRLTDPGAIQYHEPIGCAYEQLGGRSAVLVQVPAIRGNGDRRHAFNLPFVAPSSLTPVRP